MPSAVTSPVAVQCAAAKTRSSAAVVDADCLMSAGPSGYQTGSQQSPHAVHEPMPARIESVTQLPGWLSSTLAADGAGGAGALPPWIRAFSPEATVAGPALVVEVVADADGVVVWPAAGIDDYLARADEKRLADDKRAAAG